MGLEIESFTIKDVFDRVDYLDSLGISQTAVVKRDADIGVAEANRDAGIRVSFQLVTYLISRHLFPLQQFNQNNNNKEHY